MLGYEYTLEDFKQNNYEKGREEGREEGIEEGELRKQTATIIRMLENHETMEKIICYSEANEETIRKIAKENGLTIHECLLYFCAFLMFIKKTINHLTQGID